MIESSGKDYRSFTPLFFQFLDGDSFDLANGFCFLVGDIVNGLPLSPRPREND